MYDAWANREVLGAIRAAGENTRSLQLMAHILAAERVWLERLKQESQSVPVWPEPNLSQCEAECTNLREAWLKYLGEVTDLGQTISYTNPAMARTCDLR